MSALLPLAHAGHWLAETLYIAPVIVVVTWISIKSLIDKRSRAREEQGREPAPPG